jgi:hypothetical protein
VLGDIRFDLFKQFPCLIDFDYEGWILANKHGPCLISEEPGEGIRHAWWAGKAAGTLRGGWCVRIELEGGCISYVTERGKVVRQSQAEAITSADEMTMPFERAMAKRTHGAIPLIAARLAFARYTEGAKQLVAHLPGAWSSPLAN